MNLLKQYRYLYWYAFAQILTNEATTSKGKSPYREESPDGLRSSISGEPSEDEPPLASPRFL